MNLELRKERWKNFNRGLRSRRVNLLRAPCEWIIITARIQSTLMSSWTHRSMPLHNGFKINILNLRTDRPVSLNWILGTWKNFRSKTGFHMLIDLKIQLKYSIRGSVYLKRRTIRSLKSTIKRQIKIQNCMNWMKNWILH